MNDTIYRQEAIDAAIEAAYKWDGCYSVERARIIADDLKALPSAQSERMKGKWIRKSPTAWSWACSCYKRDNAYAYSAGKYYEPDVLQDLFCPNCGADMRGEAE